MRKVMLGGAVSPGGDDLLTVTVVRDEHGYGMKVSGDNPVFVQSVKEHGAAWRAGLRAGDRILRVDSIPVHHHTHQQVVHMIRANPTTVLTVQQNTSRHKTPITAPVPVNSEKQRQLEVSKVHTMRLMLEQEQKYIRDLRNELSKVPDVRKQAQLEAAELRCSKLQHEIDSIMAGQTDNRSGVPVLHTRSRSSPEQLDCELTRSNTLPGAAPAAPAPTPPPPGTPPPPYHTNTQPCADPQRAIISMEEDDSPASDTSTYSGLFSNLRSVRESKARTAVLLNWLLGERRCACASLLLILTDAYRSASGVTAATLRRWAYEIHSTFLMPNAVLQLNGVDENMANEIEHILVNEHDKEELVRNVFRKARQKAKEELSSQLSEFQVKRQVGLGTLYGPHDALLERCDLDKAQELVVVEQVMTSQLRAVSAASPAPAAPAPSPAAAQDAHNTLLAALIAAALALHCRPASVAAAVGGARASFLQRDKLYKQRVKQIMKQHPQPFVVRGHHLQLQALTSVGHCHRCDHVIWGLAPQAYVCADCKLRVHRACAKSVEEGCCLDGEHHTNRISRFMERMHPNNQPNAQDVNDKKSRKASGTAHFLNMERSFRKTEDEAPWDAIIAPAQGESRREGSTDEPSAPEVDVDSNDVNSKEADKETNWRTTTSSGRGVNRAESCRERDAPRRGKHRNASDPNRLTAHNNHDLEPGAPTAPSGSSSSSSLSSRSNESNTVVAEQQATQSDWSEEDEPLAAQWVDSVPPHVLDALDLSARLRKRQEVIHELIVSEGSHVRWLKVLGGVFLRGLEAQPSLLPPDELRALFPNLPAVRERHQRLYCSLKALRAVPANPLVTIRPLADAILETLGDPGYAPCLSRFCSGQRLALDVLRERRRKNKELHQFLSSKEQLPLCGRLQLRDLLACVWQRLTKYQLLLENILKTVSEGDEESAEDVGRLRRALAVAKDVLHGVDTAVRTAENEHRLRSIQQKLEVRVPAGGEWEELRRLDLTQRALRLEGDLAIRGDSTKKIHVLALMLEDSLVLLQREGDKFVLKPIPQSSSAQHQLLSPLVKWDKVLFRPNAAVRNTFFLMNINGVQMHELSASSAQEYAAWVKHIEEAPLAKLTELKSSLTPSHQTSRSVDDTGASVSRNPSDASEKSPLPADEPSPPERDGTSADRSPAESERDDNTPTRLEERRSLDKEEVSDREEKHTPRRPTVGCISTHVCAPPAPLQGPAALAVREPPVHTARTVCTPEEYLRRLDSQIRRAMLAKRDIVADMLGVPRRDYEQLAELCVADTLGTVDIDQELRSTGDRLSRSDSVEEEGDRAEPDVHQLLLATFAQADEILSCVRRGLRASEPAAVLARARPPRAARHLAADDLIPLAPLSPEGGAGAEGAERRGAGGTCAPCAAGAPPPDAGEGGALDDSYEGEVTAQELACRVAGAALGLQDAARRLLVACTAPAAAPPRLREHLAVLSETNHRLAHRALRAQQAAPDATADTGAAPGAATPEQASNGG
ncbi:rho guanine nucleotide exchange factor 11 isoform X3 [Bombyx mandarina]|uniref:Rho guanine nucleotide exchange factor 11 isoform X3 n=1 Tax=Bombyx mandarina TaxID=7092 RepID=A0A6J2K463_BOMMA|nr:rho guanine nucleotide exchange factor 11 isoform X3 [Bombyx mandarina]